MPDNSLPAGEANREPSAPSAETGQQREPAIYMFSGPDGEIDGLGCVAIFDSPEEFEQWAQGAHTEQVSQGDPPDPEYWGALRLWRVTIEELQRLPGTANARPPEGSEPAGGKK
jgi:hypothetical protein